MKRLLGLFLLTSGLLTLSLTHQRSALAQPPITLPSDDQGDEIRAIEERKKMLLGKEGLAKDKEKPTDPFELTRTQVAPFDVLPYVKPHHWSTMFLELKANLADYDGLLRSELVMLPGMPQAVDYGRGARLAKEQDTRMSMNLLLPDLTNQAEFGMELTRPESLRVDLTFSASMRRLRPHQMLIVALTNDPSLYARWGRFQALSPNVGEDDTATNDRLRYYRLVLPQEGDKVYLSPNPLTWTTISHVLWDGTPPESLSSSQQQAMLDWLHYGGQLVLMTRAGPSLALFQDGFLGPYLPADPSGENAQLDGEDLAALAEDYPAPQWWDRRDEKRPDLFFSPSDSAANAEVDPAASQINPSPSFERDISRDTLRYKAPIAIKLRPREQVYLTGLRPRPDSTPIMLGNGKRMLGVERRVGRGRITILGFNPTEPALARWAGLDTLVRRLILRRPEEPFLDNRQSRTGMLNTSQLSWLQLVSRDLEANPPREGTVNRVGQASNSASIDEFIAPGDPLPGIEPVGSWLDDAAVPKLARQLLKNASGLRTPGSSFVGKVVLAYLLVIVPVNWLVCRWIFRRRELAWVLVPVIALGFAVGVERAAAYNLGFDVASDELDVLEVFGSSSRGHLSRFTSLCSVSRVKFDLTFPGDLSALALPMSTGVGLIRGESVSQSSWRSAPVPGLIGFTVQPRSLSMVRSEQMIALGGRFELVLNPSERLLRNATEWSLKDAVLVEVASGRTQSLGEIPAGESVAIDNASWKLMIRSQSGGRPNEPSSPSSPAAPKVDAPSALPEARMLDTTILRETLVRYHQNQPEDQGELRLVGWIDQQVPGLVATPIPDRVRGQTVVVVHLSYGPTPRQDSPQFDARAVARTSRPIQDSGTPSRPASIPTTRAPR